MGFFDLIAVGSPKTFELVFFSILSELAELFSAKTEFDSQSEEELLRDFPWIRQVGVFAFQHRRSAKTGPTQKRSGAGFGS